MIKEYGWEEKDITLPFIPPTEAMIGKYRGEEKDKALEIAKKILIEG